MFGYILITLSVFLDISGGRMKSEADVITPPETLSPSLQEPAFDFPSLDYVLPNSSFCVETDEDGDPVRGEHALWRAVITQALMDAGSKSHKAEAKRDRLAALKWLTIKNPDFDTVCDHAGLAADYVRSMVKRALARGCQWRAEPGQGRRKRPPLKPS